MDEKQYNPEGDLSPEEEVEEGEFMKYLIELGRKANETDTKGVWLADLTNAKRFETVKRGIPLIAKGENLEHFTKENKPFMGNGAVSVIGKSIDFYNTELFATLARLAVNFEAYPRTDGTIKLDFTFQELSKRIGDM